jgi:hypothetical protein
MRTAGQTEETKSIAHQIETKPKNAVNERTALGKKRDMGRQDGTETAELRRLSVA